MIGTGACTPPEAKTPEASGSSKSNNPSSKGGAGDGDAIPLPDDADLIKEARGVNLSKLTEPNKTTFFQLINTELSPCNRSQSLAKSLRDDDKCRDSLVVAQFVADSLASGATPTQIREAIDKLVDALTPKEIPVDGRPIYGSDKAPVTVVVFADFECPHCRAEAPKLQQTVDQFRGRARLIFKHFPLEFHERAKVAAIATEAAAEQGKFWEMHDALFASPTEVRAQDFTALARKLDLDVARFEKDLAGPEIAAVVARDIEDAKSLGIRGTPSMLIGDQLVIGAQPVAKILEVVDAQIAAD